MQHHEKIVEYIKNLKLEPSIIFDIGANNGSHSIEFANCFSHSLIYSFEPDKRPLEKFRKRLKNQPLEISSRINIIESCVGNFNGEIDFFASNGTGDWDNWDSSGSIKIPSNHKNVRPEITFERTTHQITTLNTWTKQNSIASVDLIWADIQGAELDMILGASDILNSVKFINVECHNPPLYEDDSSINDIKNNLENFRVVFKTANDWFFAREDIK